ncbi:disease resistance protein UNI isoform X3 [Medicago truncatula]|uniref:disease resistance protein UNI isoform X3 n=1 Tax=Medicago truncatula TaxID=3880 RepID=UPI0019683BB0|nr:disease resistance protein UNI isoform X3 [Medicago truncatula]
MVSIPTDLAKTYLKELIDGGIARSRYICCFTCISKEYEEEKVSLKVGRETVGQRVKLATDRGDIIQKNVHYWEEQADQLGQEDTKTKKKWLFGLCPNYIWRYKRGKELANKMENIKKLVETGPKLEIGLQSRLPDVERHSSEYYISFKSRELKRKELLESLKDENNYITGLQGMGGIGKTTLAKEVGKALKQSNQFDLVIDATVSFKPNIRKIQDEIAGSLRLELRDISESDRPRMLWKRLTNGDKILLILDDVWEKIDFDGIGIPHSDNHKGCRVLLTTCNLRVCDINVCRRTIQLEILSEEDAWIMFKRYASISDDMSRSFLHKARAISNECKRLPLAISVIASSLRGEHDVAEWDEALKSLQKPILVHGVNDNLVKIYKCYKFGYDNMKDEKAKRLFLLCSVFREDEEISIETLTRLAIGVSLLGEDFDSYEDARRQVVVAKNKLLHSCLLLETNERSVVKMHDLVRDVAQMIANKEIQAVNLSNKKQKSLIEREKNIKYLLCESKLMDVFSGTIDGSKLEILIVDVDKGDHVDIPISFFENIAGIRVLHLSYQDQPTIPLMQSIESLTNIRSLLFGRVDLGDISILGKLRSLETLDLVWCKIAELPHEITNLKKLKLLNLEFCEVRKNNPFEVIKSCSSLEELYFLHSFNNFCREISLPALQRYRVCRGSVPMNDSLSKCVDFEGDGNGDFFSEATFKYLMQTAEVLQLSGIEKQWINLMPGIVPIDKGMNDLVEFRLIYDLKLQCLIDTKHIGSQLPNVFSLLVVLHLCEIQNLKVLCNGPLSSDSLKSLEELSIQSCKSLQSLFTCKLNLCNLKTITLEACPMLVSIFQLTTSQNLVLLEELRIIDCEQLENIITFDQGVKDSEDIIDGDNGMNMIDNSMFPKLKVLDMERCPLLEFIFPFFSAQDLLVHGTINISSCANLKYIFGQYQDVQLGSIKEPQLHEMPNFKGIFPEHHRTMSLSKDGCKAQKELDPVKCKCFSLSRICCYGRKPRSTSTEIPLASDDQLQDHSIATVIQSLKETKDNCRSGNTVTTILSNNLETRIKQKGKIHVEEGTTSTIANTITSSTTEVLNQQLTGQQHPLGESHTTVKISQGNNVVKRNIKEGDKLANAKNITSSTPSETVSSSSGGIAPSERKTSSQEHGDGQIAISSLPISITKPPTTQDVDVENLQETSKTNDHQASPNNVDVVKVSSITEEQFPELIRVSESKPSSSKSIPLPLAFQTPSMLSQGNTSQIVEDLSSLLPKRELEKLVSEKHLDCENLSLLTDFLDNNPSVLLRDTSLSNRYKSYSYNCLAELLKFLQNHSVLDVLGSSRSEFDELLQDVRRCGFDKDWLDGVEKRALFSDIQFSQVALQKLLDSQQHVNNKVEATHLKINILTEFVEDLKHQLTSSEADLETLILQKAQLLENKAILSSPLGY